MPTTAPLATVVEVEQLDKFISRSNDLLEQFINERLWDFEHDDPEEPPSLELIGVLYSIAQNIENDAAVARDHATALRAAARNAYLARLDKAAQSERGEAGREACVDPVRD